MATEATDPEACAECGAGMVEGEARESWNKRLICADCKAQENYAEVSGQLPALVYAVRVTLSDGTCHDAALFRSESSARTGAASAIKAGAIAAEVVTRVVHP